MKYCFGLLLIFFTGSLHAQKKPQFKLPETNRVHFGRTWRYEISATDSAGRKLSYRVKSKPAWLIFNARQNLLAGKSIRAGQFPVHLQAIAGSDTSDLYFMITVFDQQTLNILAAGNSITNGTDTFNSYRRNLWKRLHDGHYNFDFVGSWSKHHMRSEVPKPDFDMDHEGHSGWTFEHFFHPPDWDSIRGNIYSWLKMYTPDIVLLELGTNDVFQCRKTADMIKDLGQVIQVLRTANASVKIFVAQIPPLGAQWAPKDLCGNGAYYLAIDSLNKEIAASVKRYDTNTSPIVLVDQFSGIDPAVHMYDDIHPNTAGEKIMAQRWFDAIEKYLKKLK